MSLPGIRPQPRKLNTSFITDMGKGMAATVMAFGYDEFVATQVVRKTLLDQRQTFPEFALNVLVGWAPLVLAASMRRGDIDYFWDCMGGAVAYNRIDNLMQSFGRPATTPVVSTDNVPQGGTLV